MLCVIRTIIGPIPFSQKFVDKKNKINIIVKPTISSSLCSESKKVYNSLYIIELVR